MSDLTVTIVIPVFGAKQYLDNCMAAHAANTDNCKIVLVDNGTGHSVDQPKNLDAIIRNPENLGCTAAKIQGASAASTDIIIFEDVDTEVQPGWLDALLTAFEDPDVAMAGPKLIYPNGSIQCAGVRTWHGHGQAGGENRHDEHATNSDEDGCTGACMAIRRSVYEEVGGIDPIWPNAYDDVDLDLLVKEAGHKIAYVADSVIIHHESKTGPERWTHAHIAVQEMNRKWGNR